MDAFAGGMVVGAAVALVFMGVGIEIGFCLGAWSAKPPPAGPGRARAPRRETNGEEEEEDSPADHADWWKTGQGPPEWEENERWPT